MRPVLFILFLSVFTSALSNSTNKKRDASSSMVDINHVIVHDPVMIEENGTYYLFSTGKGISVKSSKDMISWQNEDPVFSEAPEWAVKMINGYNGHTWAPDIIYHEGLYHLFYSCSTFGKNTSAIGHATNPTLDTTNPDFAWTDHGPVIHSIPHRDSWNAIDPNIIIDEDDTPWMVFGSFWDGIKMVKLTADMNRIAEPQEWHSLARRKISGKINGAGPGENAVEAPFIIKHGEYYYLFVSFDYCCRGLDSNYKVAVGRSKDVTGPYIDRDGAPMSQGGGSIIAEGNDDWAGIGHCSVYNFNGEDYFIAHAYSIKNNGRAMLIIRKLSWTEDGWPEIEE